MARFFAKNEKQQDGILMVNIGKYDDNASIMVYIHYSENTDFKTTGMGFPPTAQFHSFKTRASLSSQISPKPKLRSGTWWRRAVSWYTSPSTKSSMGRGSAGGRAARVLP